MPTVITGSGCFIPANIRDNNSFAGQLFYNENGTPVKEKAADTILKFGDITGIRERRYADATSNSSCMAVHAAEAAIADADIDRETIDQIIVAHNFGDVSHEVPQPCMVPSIASRVKNRLGIKKSSCVAYDILFGCPGWLQGLIQADAFTKAGIAKRCLIIGTETLSRVIDAYDRDSMIYSDGAGAVITELKTRSNKGIISSASASYADEDVDFIFMGKSNYPCNAQNSFLKMRGRKVYEFALTHVPAAIKCCLDKGRVILSEVKKIFIHQANEKMDEAIVKRLFGLYGVSEVPADIMPMNIQTLGNSSVATIPTLYNMVAKGMIPDHSINKNDILVFASVGAGMNINAVCYRA